MEDNFEGRTLGEVGLEEGGPLALFGQGDLGEGGREGEKSLIHI
jgi:hypothetical protein